jgi:hypothetical protein
MLRATCMGPSTFLEWRPVDLVVCGFCGNVPSLAAWHMASQQCSTYVGQQAFRHVSNRRQSISGCNMAPKLKGPLCMLNISCFYASVSNISCAPMSKIFCNLQSMWSDSNFLNSSAFPHVFVYYNLIIQKYVKFLNFLFLFHRVTNKYTILTQIITLLHVSTLLCHTQAARS